MAKVAPNGTRCNPQDNDGCALHYGAARLPVLHVVPDATYPGMWRVRTPDGGLSDMVNLSRAKDAAVAIAERGPPRPQSCSLPLAFRAVEEPTRSPYSASNGGGPGWAGIATRSAPNSLPSRVRASGTFVRVCVSPRECQRPATRYELVAGQKQKGNVET